MTSPTVILRYNPRENCLSLVAGAFIAGWTHRVRIQNTAGNWPFTAAQVNISIRRELLGDPLAYGESIEVDGAILSCDMELHNAVDDFSASVQELDYYLQLVDTSTNTSLGCPLAVTVCNTAYQAGEPPPPTPGDIPDGYGIVWNATDGQWDFVELVEEAPEDGKEYVRKDKGWAEVTADVAEHDLGGDKHNADTLENLNSKITDATIVGRLVHTQAVFVAKVGNDDNSGTNVSQPKLTIGSAITKAGELLAATATGVKVHVVDGGEYEESISVPENIFVFAPAATLAGELTVDGTSEAEFDKIISTANNQTLITMGDMGGAQALVKANWVDGQEHTGVRLIRSIGGGDKIFFTQIGSVYVGEDGLGVGDVSMGFGHVHIQIQDLYLRGDNAIGILGSNQGATANASHIVGYIDHIIQTEEASNTTAIKMEHANARVSIMSTEIDADVAYEVTAGDLRLVCPKIEGTRTGTPSYEVSDLASYKPDEHGNEAHTDDYATEAELQTATAATQSYNWLL